MPLRRNSMISEHVWNQDFDTFTNVIDVYVNYLRNKVDRGRTKKLIHTIRGSGYMSGMAQKAQLRLHPSAILT